MTSAELFQVRKKLENLQRRDSAREAFGSAAHRYEVNPPVSNSELFKFESDHSVDLPDDYRSFLLEIGNGGAGPHYGIFPLGYFDGAGGPLERWREGDSIAGVLSKPFPHNHAWNVPEEHFNVPEEFGSDEEENAWHKNLEDTVWNPDLNDGAFPISHKGCAIRNILVITGPERGNVWVDDRGNHLGIYPERSETSDRITFFDWYSSWLDSSLASLK